MEQTFKMTLCLTNTLIQKVCHLGWAPLQSSECLLFSEMPRFSWALPPSCYRRAELESSTRSFPQKPSRVLPVRGFSQEKGGLRCPRAPEQPVITRLEYHLHRAWREWSGQDTCLPACPSAPWPSASIRTQRASR